jgi:ABC-type transport system involved in multi-copper enzyme maturation permease subunit
MKAKELLEARWKLLTFTLLAFLASGGNIGIYRYVEYLLESGGASSPMLQDMTQEPLMKNFPAFVWDRWFATNGPFLLMLFAVILGGGLIAGEVRKGTIFFLLSKPVSRERILLTKYTVSAGLLLAVGVMSSLAIVIASIAVGQPLDLLHLLIATGLLWLAALFPLGLSLFFSLFSSDTFRPVVFSLLLTVALVLLPVILPNGVDWSLGHYWNNQHTYLAGGFPLKEYLVCLLTALVPLIAALVVFRRKAY